MRWRSRYSLRVAVWFALAAVVAAGYDCWLAESRAQPDAAVPDAVVPVADKPAGANVAGEETSATDQSAPGKKKIRSLGDMLWNNGEPIRLSFYGVLAL